MEGTSGSYVGHKIKRPSFLKIDGFPMPEKSHEVSGWQIPRGMQEDTQCGFINTLTVAEWKTNIFPY